MLNDWKARILVHIMPTKTPLNGKRLYVLNLFNIDIYLVFIICQNLSQKFYIFLFIKSLQEAHK